MTLQTPQQAYVEKLKKMAKISDTKNKPKINMLDDPYKTIERESQNAADEYNRREDDEINPKTGKLSGEHLDSCGGCALCEK